MKIIILGCGASEGVPSLSKKKWGKCDKNNKKNFRQRSAVLVKEKNTSILIDCGPDIKNQLIKNRINKIDAILLTHSHFDHISGLDDLRFLSNNKKKLPIYSDKKTLSYIKKKFDYLFKEKNSTKSNFSEPFELIDIQFYKNFVIGSFNILVVKQIHGLINSLGFIFNKKFGYSTDVNKFPNKSLKFLKNLDLWVVEGLREKPALTHAHFELAFTWIRQLKPKLAYLTHLDLDSDYNNLLKICPKNVKPAYDNLVINLTNEI